MGVLWDSGQQQHMDCSVCTLLTQSHAISVADAQQLRLTFSFREHNVSTTYDISVFTNKRLGNAAFSVASQALALLWGSLGGRG